MINFHVKSTRFGRIHQLLATAEAEGKETVEIKTQELYDLCHLAEAIARERQGSNQCLEAIEKWPLDKSIYY